VLRLGRIHGRRANVELPVEIGRSPLVADVVLRDDTQRVLVLIEVVNRATDLGAFARATERKVRALDGAAVLAGGDLGPYRVAGGWLLNDTAANRRLVARFPEFLRTRTPGSSAGWAHALTSGTAPPMESAVAWVDPRQGRIFPLRLRDTGPRRATLTE
jgi:hypothetical protein